MCEDIHIFIPAYLIVGILIRSTSIFKVIMFLFLLLYDFFSKAFGSPGRPSWCAVPWAVVGGAQQGAGSQPKLVGAAVAVGQAVRAAPPRREAGRRRQRLGRREDRRLKAAAGALEDAGIRHR